MEALATNFESSWASVGDQVLTSSDTFTIGEESLYCINFTGLVDPSWMEEATSVSLFALPL